MTQTHTETARQTLRRRAQLIVDALKAAAIPTTYADIIRAARAVMTIDKMLKQLWPEDKTAAKTDAETSGKAPAEPSRPLNRHERRAEAAKQRAGTLLHKMESRLAVP